MKLFSTLLIALLSVYTSYATPITATVVFENLTEQTTVNGVFFITETNEKFEINTLSSFTVELPEKGKYEFRFHTEDATALTSYPVRITERNNTITIRLEKKAQLNKGTIAPITVTTKDISNLSTEDLKSEISKGTVNFIVHGLAAISPETFEAFKNEYGIGFISKNCIVDPITYKTSQDNNTKIAAYLTSLFGKDWEKKLPAQPFGLKQ
ncbi:hypothetical protein [uncultured Gelidibacter sp.]|uniref:FEKKY domain-containing protein n=1 Tax=uncultured Gelidibacter sp. TaxID=259318 RepID=UPI00261AB7D3|nr:hypothetical protein [uncultured Gelidibacter sp.]